MTDFVSRRTFTKLGVATTAFGLAALQTSTSKARIIGANDRIRCGYIGVANRGGQLLQAFGKLEDQEVAALCDVDQKTLDRVMGQHGNKPFATKDFRKMIERADIDAVVIASPDHWHAIQMVESCKAGKDVYVEKPLSMTVYEGRKMVEAARKYKRIVQVGTHRRSSPICREIAAMGIEKKVGHVSVSRCYRLSNMFPDGIGKAQPTEPPAGLDWEMWLGPRPLRPYQTTIAPYKFRWHDLYSSQTANWGVHFFDLIRWQLGETAPTSVSAMGGRFVVDDDRTIPDTLEVCFQFGNRRLLSYSQYESSSNPLFATDEKGQPLGEAEFRGTQGTLYLAAQKCQIVPERGGQFQKSEPRMKPETILPSIDANDTDVTAAHARNFIDCMRSREMPCCDVEEGQRSTTMAHIANISLALGQRLDWDSDHERFTNSEAANALLHYEYRAPWKLEV